MSALHDATGSGTVEVADATREAGAAGCVVAVVPRAAMAQPARASEATASRAAVAALPERDRLIVVP